MIALVPGHRPGSPGAVRTDGGTEHDFARRLAASMAHAARAAELPVVVLLHADTGRVPYRARCERLVEQARDYGARALVSLHGNAGPGAGAECLFDPRDESAAGLAAALSRAAAATLGTRDRGALAQTRAWRAGDTAAGGPTGAELRILTAAADVGLTAALWEPGFVSSPAEWAALESALEDGRLATAAIGVLARWRP
jgi:N-acetylmuramoyl-L-alanine amidase